MRLHKPVPGVGPDVLRGYPAHWVDDEWEEFATKHAPWLEEVGGADLLYCLPEQVIDGLARSGRPKSGLRSALAVAAERDLSRLCRPVRAVGFSGGRFVHYPFLAVPPAGAPVTPGRDRLSPAVTDEAVVERLKGYVGRLVTDPLFLADVEPLSARWHERPESRRPILPLARFICANHYPVFGYAGTPEQKAFEEDFLVFCDRWSLAGMATWHLPVPRGPVFLAEGRPGTETFPLGMLTVAVPFFYPLLGDDALQADIYRHQRSEARRMGQDADLAGLAHFKAYGHMLVVCHLERVITTRYGRGKGRWGLVNQVEDALHEVLGVGKDQIKKLRKAVSACRRGNRAGVKWLRPRRR